MSSKLKKPILSVLRYVNDPAQFLPDWMCFITLDSSEGIYSLLGVTPDSSLPKVIAVIFSGDHWDEAKAEKWLETRQGNAYRGEWTR